MKSDHEFRGLMLGDSITMGHGVTRNEAFANQLEEMMKARHPTASFQIINAGVQGSPQLSGIQDVRPVSDI
jgi:hypothetical protein